MVEYGATNPMHLVLSLRSMLESLNDLQKDAEEWLMHLLEVC